MEPGHHLEEVRLGAHHVLDRLAGRRLRQEADEVAGMAGAQGDADLAVGFEAADAGPVPGARVDDHERPLLRIDRHVLEPIDPDQPVVDRALELAAIGDELAGEAQDVRRLLRHVLVVLVAAPAHDVEVENAPLPGVDPIVSRFVGAAGGGPLPLARLRDRLRPGLRERLQHPPGCGLPESGLRATTPSGIGRRLAPIARQGSLAVSH